MPLPSETLSIEVPCPTEGLEFTGERCTSLANPQTQIEHLHRYVLAAQFVDGKSVLDLACGEGYGSKMLSARALSVLGVDVDERTIDHARRQYADVGIDFMACDALRLPPTLGQFDVVVSFETIEHLEFPETFLRRCLSLLGEEGLLIISSPDPNYYRVGEEKNPHHIRELTETEFITLLESQFSYVKILRQYCIVGSVIASAGGSGISFCELSTDNTIHVTSDPINAPYMLAFASNRTLPEIEGSIYTYSRDVESGALTQLPPRFSAMVDILRSQVYESAERAYMSLSKGDYEDCKKGLREIMDNVSNIRIE